jgi:putative DNA primase/helicase
VSEPANVIPLHPPIEIKTNAPLHEQADRGIAALAREPNLYQQAGHLVRVVRVDPSCATPQHPEGTPDVRRAETDTLRELLGRHAAFVRWSKTRESYDPCHPPRDVAATILRRGEYHGIRPLDGVIEAPALRPDGSLLWQSGYDPATRLLFLPDRTWPRVRDEPQREHAVKALAALAALFEQIPFVRPADLYVPIAAILTLFARSAIRGAVPAFAFDSSVAGSGKSLIANVVGAIVTGRFSEPSTYPADDVELEKNLGAEALAGSTIVDFDNVEGLVEGGPLLKVLTARDKVRLRVLGLSQKVSSRWRAVVLLGGNNLAIGRQMSRRTILARIEPREERPEERTGFNIPNLPHHCLEQRERLGVAALTILRGFVCAGSPSEGVKPLGSYEEWAALVPPAIVWAGGLDVTTCRPSAGPGGDDPETRALRVLLPRLGTLLGPEGSSAGALLKLLYPDGRRPRSDGPPDGHDEVRDALEELCPTRGGFPPAAHPLGVKFRALQGRWIGGKRLVNRIVPNAWQGARWTVEST